MSRFLGIQPADEIEKSVTYRDQYGLTLSIEAGPHGWTVIWSDCGTTYGDKEASTEDNFVEAYKSVTDAGFVLERIYGNCGVTNMTHNKREV